MLFGETPSRSWRGEHEVKMRVSSSLLAGALMVSFLASAGTARAEEPASTGKGIVGGGLLGAELVVDIEAAARVRSPWAYVGGGVAGAAAGAVGGYFVEQNTDTARIPMLMLAGGLTLAIPSIVAVLTATAYEPPTTFVQDQAPADEPVAEPPRPASGAPAATPTAPAPGAPTTMPAPASPTTPTTTPAPTPGGAATPTTTPATPPPGTPVTPPPPGPATTPTTPTGSLRTRHRVAEQSRARTKVRVGALIDVDPSDVNVAVPAVEVRDVFTRTEVAMGAPRGTEVRIPVLNVLF